MNQSEVLSASKIHLRERIILASRDSFAKHGIKNTRMDDIAAALKISKRTLYEIFPDKETLLLESVRYFRDKGIQGQKEVLRSSEDIMNNILQFYTLIMSGYRDTNKAFFEDIMKYPKVHQMVLERQAEEDRLAVQIMERGVEQGVFRGDINFALMQDLARKQLYFFIWSEVLQQDTFLEKYKTLMLIYLRGISTEEGARRLEHFLRIRQTNAGSETIDNENQKVYKKLTE
ncbi:MAG: TetR/AcrR family transcriptional regulator [Prevotellaceae bacterium]|jgi:AcrR family transcriptional regulator|nr:TetR/AcrR family transcriptional regulator [Prevotellaceae bacterium]